jgi:hypothetical protein
MFTMLLKVAILPNFSHLYAVDWIFVLTATGTVDLPYLMAKPVNKLLAELFDNYKIRSGL